MLYLMRHGKTDWNLAKRLQGRTDVPLNEMGREMARQAARDCAEVPFDICYCSPLSRARETAQLVLEGRDVPIYYDDRLLEVAFGDYEGMALSQMPDGNMDLFFHHPEMYAARNGAESFEELFARTGEFLSQVVKPQLEAGKHILIVGHGAMNSSILCQVLEKPLSAFWEAGIENCKLKPLGDSLPSRY